MSSLLFAGRLQQLRQVAGMSLHELAHRSGTSMATLEQLEVGLAHPSWAIVCQLAEALQVHVGAFAGNGDEPAANGAGKRPRRTNTRALRRREARRIRESVEQLKEHDEREDFAVCTYPVLKQINELLFALADADAEGNTRAILRFLRNTLMDGGWNKYRDEAARATVMEILSELTEPVHVHGQQADEIFDRLNSAGLDPGGVPRKHSVEPLGKMGGFSATPILSTTYVEYCC